MKNNYTPPAKWVHEKAEGKFAQTNKPTAGAQTTKKLPKGEHAFQLYSLATPNGMKVTIMFEELIELGIEQAEYNAYPVNIMEGDQFGSEFVDINPNSKVPALLDTTDGNEIRVFESGSILVYLAEKFGKFLGGPNKTEVINWLFWQMGSTPYVGGGFGHFYVYAPRKIKYCIDRFAMETKRQLDVLDKQLAHNEFIAGSEYSIADIAIYPWYGCLVTDDLYGASKFLDVSSYDHLIKWATRISKRPAVIRGRRVTKTWGEESEQLPQRHSMEDFN